MRRQDHFLFRGGLDLVTSRLVVDNGRLLSVKNYESSDSGYRRLGGYERFDGRPRPSDAFYSILNFVNATTRAEVGDTIEGATSGATAELLAAPGIDDGVEYYALGVITGTFEDGEELQVSGTPVGEAQGLPVRDVAPTLVLHQQYLTLAAAKRRAVIEAVPGSGPVRGVWFYKGVLYAFRDNADATQMVMHSASATGWTPIGNNWRIFVVVRDADTFRAGTVFTGRDSGATGVAVDYHMDTVNAEAENSSGPLTYKRLTGTLQSGEPLNYRDSRNVQRTLAINTSGPPEEIITPAGGRYEFRNFNFGGQADNEKAYGVNGVGPAIEWDGDTLFHIQTGRDEENENPNHLAIHANHLMLSYPGGSVQLSQPGAPRSWDGASGAAEIGTGQEVNGLIEGVALGNTVILGQNTIQALYGSLADEFALRTHSGPDTGAVKWTGENMGSPVYMDNRGLRSVQTTERYGNFLIGSLTYPVQPWIEAQRRAGSVPTASLRMRARDTYRLFFGRTGLSVYFGREVPESTTIELNHNVRCTATVEEENAEERYFFGSDDGWVFELERGTSFDGLPIDAFARVPYNHLGSPSHSARIFKADIHADVIDRAAIRVGASFDYGDNDDGFLGEPGEMFGGGALWGEAQWDSFYWGAPLATVGEFHFSGIGPNVSLLLHSNSTDEFPHTINGVTIHYSPRRLRR